MTHEDICKLRQICVFFFSLRASSVEGRATPLPLSFSFLFFSFFLCAASAEGGATIRVKWLVVVLRALHTVRAKRLVVVLRSDA